MVYRRAGLVLIEQGVSDTLCSLVPELIPWDILEQVEVFFQDLDQHIIDDISFSLNEADAISDRAVNLPAGILDFLDDFLVAADAQAHRLEWGLLLIIHSRGRYPLWFFTHVDIPRH